MSLYANNDRIHTQVGARVQPGDILATSSDGSTFKPELYFEIRLRSRPLDPRPWLKGEPGR
jgi:septal ring factor EnvC (AmiA/AmiB activator)